MKREFNFVAILLRKNKPVWTRRYCYLDNAIVKTTRVLVRDGQVGDVIEISNAVSGMWCGTVKLKVSGRIDTQWLWERC